MTWRTVFEGIHAKKIWPMQHWSEVNITMISESKRKIAIGDTLIFLSVLGIPSSYLVPELSSNNDVALYGIKLIAALGVSSMVIHFFWMLASVMSPKNSRNMALWTILILLTYILGSAAFYFRVYRPSLASNSKSA